MFEQPSGAYASTVEHQLLLDTVSALDGLRVCDAGCGTGRFAAQLEAAGGRVTGVDRDPAALAIARTRVSGDLVEGEVRRRPFPDDEFDVTFAVTVCEFAADPGAAGGPGHRDGIEFRKDGYHDFAIAGLLGPNGERFVAQSGSVRFQAAHVDEARRRGLATHTVGEVIVELLGGSAFDPHSTVTAGYVSREQQLIPALVQLLRGAFPAQESER